MLRIDSLFRLSPEFLDDYRGRQPKWGPLGYLTFKRTYAREKQDGTTEEFWETLQRVVEGTLTIQRWHCQTHHLPFDDQRAQRTAQEMYRRMWDFKFLPPGRGLWMMGTEVVYRKGGAALNNCGFVTTRDLDSDFAGPFCFLMDMSMLGVGVGSDTRGRGKVWIQTPKTTEVPYRVRDSREGWVDLVRTVLNSFVGGSDYPKVIDYRGVRSRGTPIKGFGGLASGPLPLAQLVQSLTRLLCPQGVITDLIYEGDDLVSGVTHFSGSAVANPITSTQIVDIFNLIGKCVVAGGVRRTAELMLGDSEDEEFLALKQDKEALYDRRWASNNSVFGSVGMDYSGVSSSLSQNGEPGIVWLEHIQNYSRMGHLADYKDKNAMGTNPCVTGDTIIFTSEGPRRADKMLDKPFWALVDGKPYPCQTGVFQTGVKPVYLLQTKEGHNIRVTADHQILTAPKVTRKKRYEMWVEAQDLVPGDKVILNNVRELTLKGTVWQGKGTFEQGWVFGNLLGDGHFKTDQETGVLQFWGSTKDEMLALAIQRIEMLGGDSCYHQQRAGTSVEDRNMVSIKTRQAWLMAPEFGISHNKDLTNDTVLTASSDFQAGFLRGFFDADGSVQGDQQKGVSVRLGLANHQHLVIVQKMLMNFGINSTIYANRREAGSHLLPDGKGGEALYGCEAMHELAISNDNIRVFADRIGFDEPERKAKLAGLLDDYKRGLDRDRFVAEVESVKYVGIEPVYDCTVDEVHRFGANGITVHNCSEQTLHDKELCCLVETFPAHHDSLEDYLATLRVAYLYAKTVTLVPTHNPDTNAILGRNRRIGCSMSGIIQAINKLGRRTFLGWCDRGYEWIQELDTLYSDWLCIPRSVKTTSVKPSGTTSLLCGATPGIHYPHSEYYIRNIRVQNTSPLLGELQGSGYPVEPDLYAEDTSVVSVPVHETHFVRSKDDVTMWEQFSNAADLQQHWADNQVSITVTFRKEEARDIKACLEVFESRLKSISLLPLGDGDHQYQQAPYIKITAERYAELSSRIKPFSVRSGTHEQTDQFCDGASCVLR